MFLINRPDGSDVKTFVSSVGGYEV